MSLIQGQWKKDCENAGTINRMTLDEIVQDNKETEFGKRYHFENIKNADDFRRNVPLHEYDDLESEILRMRAGEKNVLMVYPVAGYANSSGTVKGNRKWIPITFRTLDSYSNDPDLYMEKLIKEKGGKRNHLTLFRTDLNEPADGVVVTGIYYRQRLLSGTLDIESFVGGKELFFDKNPGNVLFAKAYAALAEENITTLETIFQYDFLYFFRYIEQNWEELIDIMRSGKIPEEIELSEPIRQKLSSLTVTKERVDFLESEFRKGFEGIAKRIWPKVSILGGISNAAFFAEEEMLKTYLGGIPHHRFLYAASECYYGNPVTLNASCYGMMPRHDFFEFLPYDEETNDTIGSETLLPEETEIGKTYELIITSHSGLYRYRMGDILRVVDFCGESPVVEYVTRRGLALSLAGEKITLLQIEQAVRDLNEKGMEIEMYCFAPKIQKLPGCYLAVMVAKDEKLPENSDVSAWLDESLKRQNWDYEDLRNMGELEAPEVCFLSMEEYQKVLKNSGLSDGQNKPKHIAPNGLKLEC